MTNDLMKYKEDVTKVFGLGVDVLNVARSLNTISFDLKLLAINGIVQASKIGNKQGQSLITLSGFLSSLPVQIAPELSDLEELSRELSTQITITSIAVRKFILYSNGFYRVISKLKNSTNSSVNMLSSRELNKIGNSPYIKLANDEQKQNLEFIAKTILKIMSDLNELLSSSQIIISRSKMKIEKIRRNGFIANYMGSNISIESAYLTRKNKNFDDLVNNIKEIVNTLNMRLDDIMDKINEGQKLLDSLINSRIIK